MSKQTMFDRYLPKQPHPETGEPFLPKFEIDTDSGNTICEFYEREPMPQDRSAEEMRKLCADYEAAHADWVKRGSPLGPKLHVLPGVRITTGKFVTASGAKAEGVLLPDGTWRWTKLDWKSE